MFTCTPLRTCQVSSVAVSGGPARWFSDRRLAPRQPLSQNHPQRVKAVAQSADLLALLHRARAIRDGNLHDRIAVLEQLARQLEVEVEGAAAQAERMKHAALHHLRA